MVTGTKLLVILCALAQLHQITAWVNVASRVMDLVIHFQTIREGYQRYWIVRSTYKDLETAYYSRFSPFSDEEVISAEKTKWLVSTTKRSP